MKMIKYFAIALATLSLSACSDENKAEDYDGFLGGVNTATGVTVEMNPTFAIGENVDVFKVPVKVTGKTNGKVVVTVGVKPGPSNPDDAANPTENAVEGTNYILTSATINIPEGADEGYIECTNEWEQGVINNNRVFTMTITNVEGATLGAQKDCVVTIENVDDAYTMMCGTWSFTGTSLFGDGTQTFPVVVSPLPSDDPDYGTRFEVTGFINKAFIPMSFAYDKDTEKITMSTLSGEFACWSLYNVTGIGKCAVVSNTSTSKTGFGPDDELVATFNSIKPVRENALIMFNFIPYPISAIDLYYMDGYHSYSLSR